MHKFFFGFYSYTFTCKKFIFNLDFDKNESNWKKRTWVEQKWQIIDYHQKDPNIKQVAFIQYFNKLFNGNLFIKV